MAGTGSACALNGVRSRRHDGDAIQKRLMGETQSRYRVEMRLVILQGSIVGTSAILATCTQMTAIIMAGK